MNTRCQCGLARGNITSDGFLCFPGSSDSVTYRGEIHETETTNVNELIEHIQQWTDAGVTILVQRVFIRVDSSCRVAIDSINEEECIPRNKETNSNVVIIGGAVTGVIIIIIIVLIVGVVMLQIVLKRRKSSFNLKNTKSK